MAKTPTRTPKPAEAEVSAIGQRRRSARDAASDNYKERRQALLHAAAAVFKEKGFEAVRMDDVAQQLKVDRATLYYYFKNKNQLYHEVILEAVSENLAEAQRIAASDQPAREKLHELLVSLLSSYERSYPLLYVYVQEDMRRIAVDNSPEGKALVKLALEYDDALKTIVRQGVDEGAFRSDMSVSVVIYAVIGAANWTHRWFKPGRGLSGAEVGDQIADIFLEGVLIGNARRRKRRPGVPVNGVVDMVQPEAR